MSGSDVTIWMPLYIGDHLKETGDLSAMEVGAYIRLQVQYWSTQKPLLDDDERLARVSGLTPKEWRNVRDVMTEFFDVADGIWRHVRLDKLLMEAHANKKRTVARARHAAKKRWEKNDAPSNATGMPEAEFD